MTPTLFTACYPLPPERAGFVWGGPALNTL